MVRRVLFGVGVDVGWGLDRRGVLVRLFLVGGVVVGVDAGFEG